MSKSRRNDIFISYASEDKDFAFPLAQNLVKRGLKVWFDKFNLKIGDKLRESIDEGLRTSNFGVIILSNNFFTKNWAILELEGLVTLSTMNITRILPIWHGVGLDEVVNFSPMLASITALPSSMDLDEIASEIYKVVSNIGSQFSTNSVQNKYESAIKVTGLQAYEVKEIQNKRFRFLLRLYEKRDRTTISNTPLEIGKELGYDEQTIYEIVDYCDDNGYIEFPVIGAVEISVFGMDYVESLIPNSKDVITIQSCRMEILRELYATREQYWGINMFELGKKLGFTEKVIGDIRYYLQVHSLIEFPQLGPNIKITSSGIDVLESSIT